jgi:hypothetical protein
VLQASDPEGRHAVALLEERYPQHRDLPPTGPVLALDVKHWSGWSARPIAGLP